LSKNGEAVKQPFAFVFFSFIFRATAAPNFCDLTSCILLNWFQVTVLEVHDRKPYKIMDRRREVKKGVMAESLEELIERGPIFRNYLHV
jgi:hypothetical protein